MPSDKTDFSGPALPDIAPDDHALAQREAALRKIRRLMDFWQIEVAELAGPLPERIRPAEALEPVVHHRYRHPIYGDEWDGRGLQPEWLKVALLKEGYSVQDLRLPSAPIEERPLPPSIDTSG